MSQSVASPQQPPGKPKHGILPKLILAALSALFTLLCLEIFFRAIHYDFDRQAETSAAIPPFFRLPMVPLDPVYFRRAGPEKWNGQVLRTGVANRAPSLHAYSDEPTCTIEYDKDGFRNPLDLNDWQVAVVGDSFVESGYLPYEQLLTSVLAQRLGAAVKNLGVSHSGPYAYPVFLKHFGAAPSAKIAVEVFFEGNDVADLFRDKAYLDQFAATGQRPTLVYGVQTSLIHALMRMSKDFVKGRVLGRSLHNANFDSASGLVPITITYTPPSEADFTATQKAMFAEAFGQFAGTARGLGMTPWLIYVPAKHRVLYGRVKYLSGAEKLAAWKPSDLPKFVERIAREQGLQFLDVTPVLTAETAKGRLTYNTLYDTHLNADGSRLAGEAMAEALRGELAAGRK